MRLIDADKLEEGIKALLCTSDSTEPIWSSDVLDAIQRAPTVGGWISVEDRLPTMPGTSVLVVAQNRYKQVHIFEAIGGYGDFGWYTHDYEYMENFRAANDHVKKDLTITHWMPMPAPPETSNPEAGTAPERKENHGK